MPPLPNARHERFAQELAKGKTADEAYREAGYNPNRGNAATLKANQSVSDRANELKERGAIRAEVTIASITERLNRIADKSEALKEAAGYSVARQAAMDTAKLHGHLKDKHEHSGTIRYDFSGLDDDKLSQLEAILGTVAVIGGGKGRDQTSGDET